MKLSVLILGAVMITSSITAQNKPDMKIRESQADVMKDVVALNAEQYEKIKGIETRYREEFSKVRTDARNQQKRETLKALHDSKKTEVDAILNHEQRMKWADYKAQQKQKRTEQRGARKERFESKMRTALELTPDQDEKMRASRTTLKQESQDIKATSKTTEEKKQLLKTAFEKHEANVKSILSPDQFEKWTSMKNDLSHKSQRRFRGHRR